MLAKTDTFLTRKKLVTVSMSSCPSGKAYLSPPVSLFCDPSPSQTPGPVLSLSKKLVHYQISLALGLPMAGCWLPKAYRNDDDDSDEDDEGSRSYHLFHTQS